jgi:putative copper export protein
MIDATWLLLRAAGLILTLQGAGAALFDVLFGAGAPRALRAVRGLGQRLTLAALGVLLLQITFEPVHLGGEIGALLAPSLWRILLHGASLHTWLLRALGLALLAPSAGTAPYRAARLGGAAVVTLSFVLSGHTRTHAHAPLLGALLALHVSAVLYWYGSLWPLRQVLRRETAGIASRTVTAFSRVALLCVPLLALAGAALACLLLPAPAALLSPYGQLLLLKIALFLTAFALAALNRLRLTPALSRGTAGGAPALERAVLAEYLLISLTLAVTAVMSGAFSPEGD